MSEQKSEKLFPEEKPINAIDAARREKKHKRLTASEWAKAEAMWKSGNYTMEVIAAEFRVSVTALKHRFKKRGIKKGEDIDRHSRAITAQMDTKQIAQAKEAFEQIQKFKTDQIKYVEAIQRRGMSIFAQDVRDAKKHAASASDFKALLDLMKMVKLGWEVGAEVLHLDKEDIADDALPTLNIQKMTDDDIEELRKLQEIEEREMLGLDEDELAMGENDIVDESELELMIEEEPEIKNEPSSS